MKKEEQRNSLLWNIAINEDFGHIYNRNKIYFFGLKRGVREALSYINKHFATKNLTEIHNKYPDILATYSEINKVLKTFMQNESVDDVEWESLRDRRY